MKKLIFASIAAVALSAATPALADPNGATFADYSGPDLTTKIHASQDDPLVAPNTGVVVFGNTSTAAGHNVMFSGFSSYDAATKIGTATDIQITGGSGFAQVSDLDFDSKVLATQNLFAAIFNPDPAFTAYEFSIQLAAAGTVSIYAMLTGSSAWNLVTGSPIAQKDNTSNQYLLSGLTSGSFDQVLISSTAPIFQLKQNSITTAAVVNGPVPEPSTWAMLLLGFGGIGFSMRRSRKAKLGATLQAA